MRRPLAAAALALVLLVAPAAAAEACGPTAGSTVTSAHAAKTKVFKNCTAMHRSYAGGVAKSSKVHNTKTVSGHKVAAKSKHKPKVSAALYAANKKLDRDKDGIACES
ncbi:excalibur calcium-binding domain-containing protein [Cellulomonas edaphi]|uniref:Excalibur calcium-binding domain-containing protein n=1 Tax=Cellulomonas edaphi TaxID=3053468 RepID=A0ABT7SAT0_9CELL|nr:excalibur calcium-binding domain-containing protein [Cellulomons edaphi]MDM7832132.1 excalibur calcium-binding domain-containing protein [Cellulomons edaphi]